MIVARFWRNTSWTFHDRTMINITKMMFMRSNEDNDYKANSGGTAFRKEIRNDIESNLDKFNDPVVLGELLFKLMEERENTNRILKNILAKLDALDAKGVPVEKIREETKQVLLPEIDQRIMDFIKRSGKVTAEEVRKEFKYKGKNAASARLNRLRKEGLLSKKQVGKKVFFFPDSY